MIAYYIFFSFFGLLSMFDYLKQDEVVSIVKKRLSLIGFLLIVVFVGLRYKLASDWSSYTVFYENSSTIFDIDFEKLLEPGFNILLSLFKTFNLSFEALIFSITLYNTISLFSFINRNEIRYKYTLVAILLILNVFREFDIIRQSLAFYTMLYAFSKNKTSAFKFFMLCIIATSFHYTAVIYIVFYFFLKIKITKNRLLLVLILYFISLFYAIPVISLILGSISSSFEYIIKAQNLISIYGFERNISFSTMLNLIFLIVLYLNYNRLRDLTHSESSLLKMFIFYILIFVLCKEIKEVADRLSYYYTIGLAFMFCLLPIIPIKDMKKYMLVIPLLFIFMKLGIHSRDKAAVYGITPYRNVIFKESYNEGEIMERYHMMQSISLQKVENK